jgi:hypothetical protein
LQRDDTFNKKVASSTGLSKPSCFTEWLSTDETVLKLHGSYCTLPKKARQIPKRTGRKSPGGKIFRKFRKYGASFP